MNNYLIDTHSHLHDAEFFTPEQAEKMLKNAFSANVKQIICIGTSDFDSKNAKKFAKVHKDVFWTYGIHPESADNYTIDCEKDEKLVAIGEVGLDYHYQGYNKENQIKLLEETLELAMRMALPVSFHVRDAFPDIFGVLNNFPKIKGVFHSFSDSEDNLKEVLKRGFFIGINGMATFANLECYKHIEKTVPLEKILLETDAPFLTPSPKRGIINESAYVKFVADWLSKKLDLDLEEIERKTTENGRKLFNLPDPELR